MSTAPDRILGGKYRLIRPLEAGGMGSVWLAQHLSLAAPVAVKLIATEVAKSEERRHRFLREAQAAAALRGPHVVQILDYGVDEGTPYIVMELLEGESLADRLLRLGRLDPSETELMVRQVSRAVARAHDLGIVHRDLKPANIFISSDDEEEVVKLFDFGIAKAMREAEHASAAKQTRTGTFLGTPAYMSPEQLEGSKLCDFRTDIWAMGVIAFECLLGRVPFDGAGIGGLVLAVCSDPPPVPSAQGAVPAGFDAWFARACAREPDQRFASARELAQELRRLLEPAFDASAPEREPNDRGSEAPVTAVARAPRAPRASQATKRLPSPPVHPSTGAASSTTIERSQRRHYRRLLSFSGPFLALLALLIAFQLFREQRVANLETVQAISSLRATSDPRALAEGADPLPPLDGHAVVPLPQALAPIPLTELVVDAPASEPVVPDTSARAGQARHTAPARSRRPASRRAKARLTVTSLPASHVVLDGAPVGTTPLHELEVAPGPHRVTFIYGKQRKAVVVRSAPGQSSLVSVRFRASTAVQ